MTTKRARELKIGDLFRMHIYGEVIATTPSADGKRVLIRIELENQGHRANRTPLFTEKGGELMVTLGPATFSEGASSLEFTDAGHTLEFICRSNRAFHVYDDDGDDDDGRDDDDEPVVPPTPGTPVPA